MRWHVDLRGTLGGQPLELRGTVAPEGDESDFGAWLGQLDPSELEKAALREVEGMESATPAMLRVLQRWANGQP